MAAAGTLSRPSSAQGSYTLNPYHTYYSPPSPTIAGTYPRPSSAGANYASESFSPFRKNTTRPIVTRLATSSQYIPPTSSDAPTRIYGTRSAMHSADDLSSITQQHLPAVQLQRNYTAPDLRPLIRDPNRDLNKLQALDINSSQSKAMPIPGESVSSEAKHSKPDTNYRPSNYTAPPPKRYPRTRSVEDVGIESAPLETYATQENESVTTPTTRVASPRAVSRNEQSMDLDPSLGYVPHRPRVVDDAQDPRSENVNLAAVENEAMPMITVDTARTAAQTRVESVPPMQTIDQANNETVREANLPPRSQTPVPMNYLSPEKSKSLKNRLRRALSLGSSSKLSDSGMEEQRASSKTSSAQRQKDNPLYGQRNRSTDNISVASNASSASMILRRLSHGLTKKTKRSINNLFSGSRSNDQVASRESITSTQRKESPIVGNINYINAEPRPSDRPQSPQREIFNKHTRAQGSIASMPGSTTPAKVEITQAASNVNGSGSVAFPRLSEEIAVDEDRSKRASMHLERPLPIDLAERSVEPEIEVYAPAPLINEFGIGRPDHLGSVSKGILKRPQEVSVQSPKQDPKASDSLPETDHGFDFSFEPIPEIAKFSFSVDDPTPPSTTPPAQTSPASVLNPPVQGSKSGGSLKFSPRITIHDTYTATEYDRRGELATCNRLTPILAQRIKEELNAYKMDEMQVAEESKMYTHFFS